MQLAEERRKSSQHESGLDGIHLDGIPLKPSEGVVDVSNHFFKKGFVIIFPGI